MPPIEITSANLTASNVAETEYSAYSSGTTYAVGAFVIYNHKIYQSLQASNLNHQPDVSDTWWLDVGATNRYRMFDSFVETQTTNSGSIDITITPTSIINAVSLLNIEAATVQIVCTAPVDGEVFNEVITLVDNSSVSDWFRYFFDPVSNKTSLYIDTLPIYSGHQVRVIINNPGLTAKCGCCLLGMTNYIGETQYGAKIGIQDYSVKTVDQWGNYSIVKRAYRKTGNFSVMIDNNSIDRIQILLAAYRATPVLYVASSNWDATLIYGFYKDFGIDIQYFNNAVCSIDVEGLT